jgi:putative membrane protein
VNERPSAPAAGADAYRRTRLASERTELAWWRTGLTAIAVALGVGAILPEIDSSRTEWPHVVLGAAFALYGVALIVIGTIRGREVDDAVARGRYSELSRQAIVWLTAIGALLGLATAVLLVAR